MRDVPVLKLLAVMLVLTVITSVIMLIPDWNGVQGSTAADDIDRLLDVAIVLSSFVFSVVMVLLGYAIWRWRAKPGDESDGEPIHGNTRLEIAWTVIPTLIVAFLGAISWIVLDDIEAKEPDRMPLDGDRRSSSRGSSSTPRPARPRASSTSRSTAARAVAPRPRRAPLVLGARVADQARPRPRRTGCRRSTTTSSSTPDREGTFTLICTELCGVGPLDDARPVVVESEAEFDAWLAKQPDTPPEDDDATGGEPTGSLRMRSMSRMSTPEILTAMAGGNA